MIIYFQYNKRTVTDPRGELYADNKTCISCHKETYNSYLQTAHFQTSAMARANTIHGSFLPGKNTFVYDSTLRVVMERKNNHFYQTAYKGNNITGSQKFDLIFGYRKGQTYLYWKNDELKQLPVSYFDAVHTWTNSPGYATSFIDFNRAIATRCFECHSSYIAAIPDESLSLNQKSVKLDKNTLITGIDCQRCHGPAAKHVTFHLNNPSVKTPQNIIPVKTLSRGQKMDVCAVCHSGNSDLMLRSTFKFKPGDTLSNFKEPALYSGNPANTKPDVHGNQVQLLTTSKCFISSRMDCGTCHNVHQDKPSGLLPYTQKCLSCHSVSKHTYCKMPLVAANQIKNRCIDCHMPNMASNTIVIKGAGQSKAIPYLVRTHHIAVYPEETKKVVSWLKMQK